MGRSLDFGGYARPGLEVVRRSVSTIAEYVEARELAKALTLREIRGQYKGSVLGWFWSLLNPLTTVAVFTFFFAILGVEAPVGDPSGLKIFALYLITGLVPWNFFAASVNGAAGSIVMQGSLISKVYFPRGIVVVAKLGAVSFTTIMEMSVAMVILLIAGNMVLPWIPMVLVLLVIQATLALGLGLILSVANVYFRDVQYFVTILLQVGFYSTPIAYPMSLVEAKLGETGLLLYRLNPMVNLIEAYHNVLYDLRWPELGWLAYVAAWAVGMLLLGSWLFSRFESRLAEEL
jgi:lipopolysaccharide transport system permease protein